MKRQYIPTLALLCALTFGACTQNETTDSQCNDSTIDAFYYGDIPTQDSTENTYEYDLEDFHTLIVCDGIDIHYTTDPGQPHIKITCSSAYAQLLTPRVDHGRLIVAPGWLTNTSSQNKSIVRSGTIDIDTHSENFGDVKCVSDEQKLVATIEVNSHSLQGVGYQSIPLGRLSRQLKSGKAFEWKEDYLQDYDWHIFSAIDKKGQLLETHLCEIPSNPSYISVEAKRSEGKTTFDLKHQKTDVEHAKTMRKRGHDDREYAITGTEEELKAFIKAKEKEGFTIEYNPLEEDIIEASVESDGELVVVDGKVKDE